MSQKVSFNLVDEPWVRIRDEAGEVRELSLLELFEQAPHIKCLANDLPTLDFAILRVTLAVLPRAISRSLDEEDDPADVWSRLWAASEFPLEEIREYLDEWHDRFDLFDDQHPFMQVADLRMGKDEVSDVKKIIADVPDGDPLFSLRAGKGAESLSYSEAARWLIHVQAFDTSGIKSGTIGDPRVKGGKSYPIGTGWAGSLGCLFFEGSSLFETIMLNFIVCGNDKSDLFSEDDLPCWERSVANFGTDNRTPTGRLDLYTWQSRRVRLVPGNDRVIGVVLTNGDKLESRNMDHCEPMTAWRRSEAQEKKLKLPLVYLPRFHRSDRALWRGLDSVFGDGLKEEKASILRSNLEEWVSYLASNNGGRCLDQRCLLEIHAIGFEYGTQNSIITNSIDDKITLSAFLLSNEGESLVAHAKECVSETSEAIMALGNFAANLCKASGGSGASEINGARQGTTAQAYFEIDAPFRAWLADLNANSNVEVEIDRWRRTARSIIKANAFSLMQGLSPNAIVGAPVKGVAGRNAGWMTASRAEAIFYAQLKKSLPLEEDDIKEEKEVRS